MKEKNKHFGRILFSVLLAVTFIVFAGIKPIYANILSPKQGINEYHFYDDTIENKDSAKEIQKQIILDGKEISDPGHLFKDKDKVFLKWQDEDGNEIKFDTPIEIKGNDKKIIKVYPVFKSQVVITYYIVGDKNDRVYMTDTISDADSYKLPEDPTIYDANKYFVNWSTSKDGKSGVYDEESLEKDIAAGKTDIKLYAITELKYKATFITGDGASFQEQILADDGSHLEKMPEAPTREGYEFSHWSLKKDGDPVDLNTLELSKDITVYAVWKPVVVDYKFKVMTQNIDDDGYTFLGIISARGLNGEKTSLPFKGSENPDPKVAPTGPIVEDISKLSKKDGRFSDGYNSKDENGKMNHTYTNPQTLDYEGFHLNEEKTKQAFETIKADGSTVVPVYMDRNVHTIWVYKNASATSYNRANWVNATDNNGNIHVDLRYGQSSEEWFVKLNQDYIYYMDKSIGSFYTRAPAMADKDINMYRVYAKGTKFQLRFVEWDPSKFNADINRSNLATLQNTLGKMKEIGKRVSFQNSEWYYSNYGYRVFEPVQGMWQQITYSWVDKTDHVDDIKGFEPKTGTMGGDNNLQSVDVNNPAFRDYMFAAGKNVGGYQNYTGTPYIEDGTYVGFLFYERKTYNINYYSGSKKLDSKPYKYEADTSDFGLDYVKGETTNSKGQVFQGWYEDSEFNVEHKHEAGAKMPAHNITVYAKWDSRKYEVTFHKNQDDYEKDIEKITEIPEADTLYDGKYKDEKVSEENFPKPIQPKDATDFLGWYEKNKNGRFVKANLHKQIKNNDTHLYAKWKYAYLELKYDLNLPETDKVEGKAPTDSSSYITDAKAQVQDIGNVKVNGGKKVFVGWSETKDGSSGLIKPSETVLMDKNKTLYAQWKEIKDSSLTKVTYDPNGGKGSQYTVNEIVVEDFHKVLDNDKDENLKYTREGYAFKGWSRDKAATKAEFQADEEVNVNKLEEDKNNYIYAIWAPIINYTTDGNGQVKEGENFVDKTKEEVELKSNPKGTETKANDGYKFSHWTADKEITLKDGTKIPAGEKITEEQLKQAVITEPLIFTAHFVQDKFNVKHEFKVAEDSPVKEMPADVKTAVDSQLPKDKTAENGSVVKPTAPTQTEVKDTENDGTWKFEGYKDQDTTTDEVDAKVNGKDVTFEGKWKFTPNKHKVTYEYVSGTKGVELPAELKAKAPKDVTGKVKGDTVTSPVPTGTDAEYRDETNKGTWKFKSFDKSDVTITDKDEKVTGTWEFTPDQNPEPEKHNVTHKFVSKDPNKELPEEVTKLLPEDQTGKVKGDEVKPTEPETKEVKVKDGTWKFVSYDKDSKTVEDKDVEFTGTWEFTPNQNPEPEKHNVTHKFVSKDPNKELPEEVTKLLPEDQTGKVKGDEVKPTEPETKEVKVKDGTWKFVSYDKDSKTVEDKDVEFTGTWEFTPNQNPEPEKHNVTHKFVSKDPNKELPEEVTKLLPEDQTGKVKGDEVKPTEPETKEVKVKDGTWKFVSYDKDSKTVEDKDVEFTGTWEFTPNQNPEPEKHNVTHKFVSKDPNKELPEEVTKLLPEDQTGKVKGDEVKPTEPETKEVKVKDGTWKFVSYDKDSKTVEDKDVEFTGTWEFTPNQNPEPEKHKVTHKFVSKDPNKELPEEVTKLLPEDQTGKVKGDEVKPTEPKTKEVKVKDGTWKFVSYDKDSKTVEDKDVEFTGTWEFTPEVVTEYVDEDGKTIAPKENGTQPNKDIEGYEFVKTEKDDKGNTKHIYKKKTTPPTTEVVTKYVDEKGNPINLEEKGKQNKKDIPAYEYVKTYTDKDGNTIHVYRLKQNPTPSVETRYVDEKGNQLLPPKEGEQSSVDIDGYNYIRTSKDNDGNIIHTYSKTPFEGVETRFVDTEGNQILADKAGTLDPSLINGYKFVRTEKDEQGNTTHIYKKLPTPAKEVVTKFLDENGNKLASPLKGRNPSKEIPGYEILRTETDSDGNIIYVYRRKAPESQKVTKYVDENGNKISEPTKGDNPKKDIDGYEFVKTEKDKDGNTVHIYKKKTTTPTVDKITKFVDENGKEISKSTKGDNPKMDIDGYEFVKTTTDKDGNTVHIYKKKTTTPTVDKITKFVDENGKEISKSTKGDNPKMDIDGYEFVKTTTDKDGNTVHIYKKKTTTPTVDKITKFVDENGKEISKSTKGDNPKMDIDGYEFVRTETDKDGNTVHIYKKKENTSKVVTKFVDEKGNPIAESEDGKKAKKDIDGYEFVKTETDKDGNTVHIYKKKTTTPTVDKITKFVDENGNKISEPTKGDNPKKDIDGYEFVKTETDKDGNTVHIYKKKTTTPTVDKITKFVDENGNKISEPTKGDNPKKDIDGYEFVKTETDKDGNTVHIYKKKTTTPTVDKITKFVDENGNKISEPTKGDNPKKDIDGYEFVKTETDKDGNTVHIYKKKENTSKVVTKFVDEKGNPIAESEDGKKAKKDIKGYEFVRTETDKDGNTVHIYKKKENTSKVVTKFVDEKGNPIAESEDGKKAKKDIKGYEFVRTETDKDGNTVHIYKKKENTSKVVTKFVDEKGNPIAESEDGKKAKKDIKGYEFVRTETDKDGNTVHIYKKKENTSKVVTKFVDEKGNPIAESEDGKKAKKDIKGYEFVRTETDKDGNTVHIYKKKTNTRLITQGNNTINSSSPNKKGTLVNTGDGVNASTYEIIMLAIGGVLTGIGIRKKKKEA
ncbi:SHIRT domain-containing protein [Finegoldia magna]|uniref:SHIRT domain-containing protein n=1 Tax=Finegoldia magna TaxID=1260 RepID=UPI0032475608